jgi:MscS family membrane protein
MDWAHFLTQDFLGNSTRDWVICLSILAGTLVLNRLLAKLLSKVSYRFFRKFAKQSFYDKFHELLHKPFIMLVNLVAIYIAFYKLDFPAAWDFAKVGEFGLRLVIKTSFVIAVIFAVTALFLRGAEFMEYVYQNLEDAKVSPDLATFIRRFSQVGIYISSFFVILGEAFHVNIAALIAGLGIGGLAIALAAQDTLANLIGSFIIYLDKPFKVGEIVEIDDIRGVVEKIGFRTTRIRTLDRSLLIIPNKKIIDSNLNNISQSNQRRVKFNLELTYQSKPQNILSIIADIKEAILSEMPITASEMTVRFADFSNSSLTLVVIYFVNSNEYEIMIEVKEKINVKIMEIVAKYGCDFAYPTQTIYVQK